MRLFVAVDLDTNKALFDNIKTLLPLKDNKIKLVDSYHLTLKFLGEVDETKVNDIISRLNNIDFNEFEIILDHIGFFPDENYIKVVWLGLKQEEKIIELKKKVDSALFSLFPKEKDYKPHLTLARVGYIADKSFFTNIINSINIQPIISMISSFSLFRSELLPQGPRYTELSRFQPKPF